MENQKTKMSPKDFFLHIGALFVLYVGFGTLITLIFRIIDAKFPNSLNFFYTPSISWQVASLLVLTPVYLILMWLISKTYAEDSSKKNLGIRKWLTYLTLFISAVIVIGNLITLLFYFIDGQTITTPFLLKALSLFALALLVFSYYFLDLRDKLTKKCNRIFAGSLILIVLVSIIFGFSVFGSPATQRSIKLDREKIMNLQTIQNQIVFYWQDKNQLPETLDDVKDPLSNLDLPTDPQSGEDYIYKKTGNLEFELCAEFNLPSDNQSQARETYLYDPSSAGSENWNHEAGEFCFERAIDPERHSVNKNPFSTF